MRASNLIALTVLATAFGVVEAAIVVALRRWLDPTAVVYPAVVMPVDLLPIECSREAGTLVVLTTAAYLAAPTRVARWAAFFVAFGTWDLVYYAVLHLWMGWPRTLLDWDLLFLLPVPWFGPVVAPIVVSIVLVSAGLIALRHEHRRGPFRVARVHGVAAVLGALLILASFILPARGAVQPPSRYPIEWFAIGLAIGISAFVHAWVQNRSAPTPRMAAADASSSAGGPTSIARAPGAPPSPAGR